MRKQTGKQDLRLNYQSDGGILLFREAVEEKKLMLHFSVLREALIWKAPCSLWPVLSGWPMPLRLSPSFQGPSDDFPCFSDDLPVSCLCFPKSSRSRFKNERYTSLDVLHTTSHCSRGAIVITTNASLPALRPSHLVPPESSGWRKEGYDPENKQEETCYPSCAFFKTWPRQHDHGAQKWPLTGNTGRWKWDNVRSLFVFTKLNTVLFSRENVFLTLSSPTRN